MTLYIYLARAPVGHVTRIYLARCLRPIASGVIFGVHAPRRREWGQGVTSEMVAGSAAKFHEFFWPETFREIFH